MMLFTHRAELNDSLQNPDIVEETKGHVRLLLQFLREDMPRTSAKLDEIEAGTCRKISFQDLWLLYPPNTSVYTNVDRADRQMVVYSRNVPEKNLKGQWGVLSLYCWSAMYQGDNLIRDFFPWVIQPFTGERNLAHLDLVPIQYLPERKRTQARLIERGHRYYELNDAPSLQDYIGNHFPRVFKDVSSPSPLVFRALSCQRNLYVSSLIRIPTGPNADWIRHVMRILQRNTDFPKAKSLLSTIKANLLKGLLSAAIHRLAYIPYVIKNGVSLSADARGRLLTTF